MVAIKLIISALVLLCGTLARVSSSGGGGKGEASLPKHPASPPLLPPKREGKEREKERERGEGGGGGKYACFWCYYILNHFKT